MTQPMDTLTLTHGDVTCTITAPLAVEAIDVLRLAVQALMGVGYDQALARDAVMTLAAEFEPLESL